MTSATPKPRAGEHTKGPWRTGNGEDYNARQVFIRASEYDDHICVVDTEANARRIVACVNACEGIPTEILSGVGDVPITFAKVSAERDLLRERERELVEALTKDADTFRDLIGVLELLNRPVSAQACAIAEHGCRSVLAKHGR